MKLEELGRRAVACKHWKWMPGMLARGKVPNIDTAFGRVSEEYAGSAVPYQLAYPWPDLFDPATLGCLLHLVRKAWSAPHAAPQWDQRWQHWAVLTPNYNQECESWKNLGADDTEAEALVAALEAAP